MRALRVSGRGPSSSVSGSVVLRAAVPLVRRGRLERAPGHRVVAQRRVRGKASATPGRCRPLWCCAAPVEPYGYVPRGRLGTPCGSSAVGEIASMRRRLLDGARAFRPEDCGGIPGYEDLLAQGAAPPEGPAQRNCDVTPRIGVRWLVSGARRLAAG